MTTATKYNPSESPIYPSDATERKRWLRARGWRCDDHGASEPERWRHPDYLGKTFSRTSACKVESGYDPECEAQ
jgi:hypothetical protein